MAQKQNVIVTQNLSKSFGNIQALSSINLSVPRNSIFGFLGPNGAGKTTLMKILLGLSKPTSGGGTIFGYDIVRDSVAIRERIGYLPQHPRFMETMTARENLRFTARFFYQGQQSLIDTRCQEMLNLVGLSGKADRPIKGFSGGEKQRLGIALAQINAPDLLILDEPASALDPLGRQAVLSVMEQLREHTTIFYSTHILDDVQRVSDTVAILNRGKLVASGPIEQLLGGTNEIAYTLTVAGNPHTIKQRLNMQAYVTYASAVEQNGRTTWFIQVNDAAAAEANLLRFILEDPQLTVTEFSRKKYELEEVFMEVVKGRDDGRN